MRILWLSPWMRPLARVHVEALAARGHEVLLVTTDQHPESDTARPYEVVLSGQRKDPRSWAPLPPARARITRFSADVVVGELVRDPRWAALAAGRPRLTVIHDDRPHDAGERRPRWERALFDRWQAAAAGTVVFSDYVADEVRARGVGAVTVVPLTSDLDERLVPAPAPAAERRDVVVLGRLRPYKNIDVTLAAWEQHVAGPHWRGDDLVLIGAADGRGGDGGIGAGNGEGIGALPPHVRHRDGSYRYPDVLDTLRRAKASVVHYRQASQSGVQTLAMQLGVTPIASPCGALPAYQPPGEACVGVDDVAGLGAAFDGLADPVAAAQRGLRAREHYRAMLSAEVVAAAWEDVLTRTVRAGGRRGPSSR